MKKLIYTFLSVAVMTMASSCEEEHSDILVGGDGSADLSGRQYANIDPPTIVNFLYQATDEVAIPLGKFSDAGTTISSVEVTKTLHIADLDNDPDTDDPAKSASVTYTVTGDSFTQSLSELFADVPVGGSVLTEDDLAPGDRWEFSYVINVEGEAPTSEKVLNPAVSTSVPFACVSAIPTDGTWLGETQEGAFGVFSSNSGIEIEAIDSDGNYRISDVTGGFYTAFGFNTNQPANFNDLCNIVTITSAPEAQFNLQQDPDELGSWDPVTEVLTISWYDAGNDFEDTTVFTQE